MSHNNAYDHMVVVTDAAVDYWRMDQDSDAYVDQARTTATFSSTDDSANLLPAANNNGSQYFDGTNNYVQVTYGNLAQGLSFPQTGSFTVEAWIKPASDQSATDVIGIAQKPGAFGIYLAYGCPTVFVESDGDLSRTMATSSTAVSSGSIYHIVGIFEPNDGDTPTPHGHLYLYVNNSLVASTTLAADKVVNSNTAASFVIGSWDSSTLFFNGRISNVALYDGYLTSTKIGNHYGYSG